jgi:hypothetical protein
LHLIEKLNETAHFLASRDHHSCLPVLDQEPSINKTDTDPDELPEEKHVTLEVRGVASFCARLPDRGFLF